MKRNSYQRVALVTAFIALLGLIATGLAAANRGRLITFSSKGAASAKTKNKPSLIGRTDQTTRSISLNVARVSIDANNRLVVSMDASGDLPGEITFMIDRNADNTIRGGDWALVVARAEYTGPTDEEGDQPGMVLVRRGTLWGSIASGTLVMDDDGKVVSLTGLQLTLASGSMEFDGANGSGSAQATDLQDTQTSSGSLVVTF